MDKQNFKEIIDIGLKHHEHFKKENAQRLKEKGHDYSLLSSVLKPNDEVRLHSRFIYSMINPESLHYKGAIFLEAFLNQLPSPLNSWINLNDAIVEKENDQIDLLIHDGNNFLIVENKVDATDQPYQITRYIQTIQERFELSKRTIAEKIAVIYLSAKRKLPSNKSQSLAGFKYKGTQIEWYGLGEADIKRYPKLKNLDLELSSIIPFVHYSYYGDKPSLKSWTQECERVSEDERLMSAFFEYKKILDRLQPNLNWKNKMTFDEYVLSTEKNQKELYKLMVESKKSLEKYVAQKVYQVIQDTFQDEISNHGNNKLITPQSLYSWFTMKGNKKDWKNVGFTFLQKGKEYRFLFGKAYVYCINVNDEYQQKTNAMCNQEIRPLVLEKGGLEEFLNAIKLSK